MNTLISDWTQKIIKNTPIDIKPTWDFRIIQKKVTFNFEGDKTKSTPDLASRYQQNCLQNLQQNNQQIYQIANHPARTNNRIQFKQHHQQHVNFQNTTQGFQPGARLRGSTSLNFYFLWVKKLSKYSLSVWWVVWVCHFNPSLWLVTLCHHPTVTTRKRPGNSKSRAVFD